jgi:type IV secretion system protein VirB6
VNACPAILSGDAGLAAGMSALDCQINAAVTLGYGRLFAPGGVFGGTLTSLLTLYVAFIAFGLITGRTRLTLPSMTPKVLTLGLILTFATAWPAYQAVVYGLLTKGPDQIASAFLGGHGGAARAFADRLDVLFEQMTDVAEAVSGQGQANAPNVQTAIKLTWASALTLLISTAGLLIVSRIVLAVLLALGPVFIVLALFQRTRGLFEGWLKTATALAFTPMLLVLGGSGVLAALSPIIATIADDPAAAVQEMRPILTLFLGAVIYAMLLVALAWTAVSLTRGWSLKLGERTEPETSHTVLASESATPSLTARQVLASLPRPTAGSRTSPPRSCARPAPAPPAASKLSVTGTNPPPPRRRPPPVPASKAWARPSARPAKPEP